MTNMKLIASTPQTERRRLAVYGRFDQTAKVWELFSSPYPEDYIGCADTLDEARQIARARFSDWNNC